MRVTPSSASLTKTTVLAAAILLVFLCPLGRTQACAASCGKVVRNLNERLAPAIDEPELVEILRTLNRTNHRKLPARFVNKKTAAQMGWKPGRDLWSIAALRGCSIGGDAFWNREERLPEKKWREADLDYKGGRRGPKRLVFSTDGARYVTVDHYRTFTEVLPCR